MLNVKITMLDIDVNVSLDTLVMAIHALILMNVLPVSHHVTSMQPVPTKREVTIVHVIQVSMAPVMLAVILTNAKTNHVTQTATAKTLSDHSNVLVKMDFRVMDSTVLISTNVISVHITATKMPLVLILSAVLPVPARKDTPVME